MTTGYSVKIKKFILFKQLVLSEAWTAILVIILLCETIRFQSTLFEESGVVSRSNFKQRWNSSTN